ncbi:hypothetical protein SCLCIDRAFT_16388 [Scleroderma citrinum Foug A]|uniref:Amino acid permease/ SLC12A domain-containing protein n=1 Tax=Scleroderma citrinum Foug A TaxID=1036808 RepID=A0A0C2ZEF1_9AGAM|nr:hypothetical protein SCLCIDRAFT_16388 [Scleroderma citrinum Foug A]
MWSAVSLIFNAIIGSSIFSAPSVILRSCGSVGITFVVWIIGALVSAAGTAVFIELGTGLPTNGGDKTYLEYIYRRPAFMMSCVFASYGIFLRHIASAAVAFGEYMLHAVGFDPTDSNVRIVASLCIILCFVVHGVFPGVGVKLQDTLGLFKFGILVLIAVSGLFSLVGVPGFSVGQLYEQPRNFTWSSFWEGSNISANALINGIHFGIWSYVGYSNANFALAEFRDPIRTIKHAAPFAVFLVTFVYIFVNIAFYAVVSKSDILNSRTITAALFFRNLYGPATEGILSALIALSILGNMLALSFARGLMIQEFGREGILPYSSLVATNQPFHTPLPGFFILCLVSVLTVLLTPVGDAYNFIVNSMAYSVAVVNLLISGGLLLLYSQPYQNYNWNPPYQAPMSIVMFFFISNVFLLIVPLIPPSPGYELYQHLPYYSHVVMALFIGLLGVCYWFIYFKWIPGRNGYWLRHIRIDLPGVLVRYVGP